MGHCWGLLWGSFSPTPHPFPVRVPVGVGLTCLAILSNCLAAQLKKEAAKLPGVVVFWLCSLDSTVSSGSARHDLCKEANKLTTTQITVL